MNPDLLADQLSHPTPRSNWKAVWSQQAQRAVLFDLDGTLLDTAADLGGAANAMRIARGLAPLPIAELRPCASRGARGLIQKAFGIEWNTPEFEPLKEEFLQRYESALAVQTQFMEGLEPIVNDLEQLGMPWGVVTNKFERFTQPLVKALGLDVRMAICVSGDTTAYPKPHPEPLRFACERLGVRPESVVYIGDDYRDILSGYHAGCHTIAAAFGFCSSERPVHDWGADALARNSAELHALLLS
ncbi:MAG: HAD family hydrolase [Burkholderiaceae bacterium]